MKEYPAIATLLFHSVRKNAVDDLFAIDPTKFAEIMALISEKFGTVDISQFNVKQDNKTVLNQGKVLLTFDDGYEDNATIVLPILEKYKIKALFFLLPKYIGLNNLWNTRATTILNHLSLKEARTVTDLGHMIGSHGLTHHRLSKFSDEQVKIELVESKEILQEMLRVEINCFAYPYGTADQRIIQLTGGVYQYAFSGSSAPAEWQSSNNLEIRREFVWPHNSLEEVEKLIINFGTYNNNPYK